MSFHRLILIFLLFIICAHTYAENVVYLTPPPPKEIIVVPDGHIKCHIVSAGYSNGNWHDKHKVCEYPRGTWISAYWQCLRFKSHSGTCVNWSWVPTHWEGRGGRLVLYRQPQPSTIVVQSSAGMPPPSRVVIQPPPSPVVGPY